MNSKQLYILELEKGKYYVGTSKNVNKGFNQHVMGFGSQYTSLYKPLKILDSYIITNKFEEDNKVKELMEIYGIDNVRGGAYSQIYLDQNQIKLIQAEIKHSNDECIKCGSRQHFIKNCPLMDKELCYKCESTTHFVKNCPLEVCHKCGIKGHFMKDCPLAKEEICYKCGRKGHFMKDCHPINKLGSDYHIMKNCHKCGSNDHLVKNCPLVNKGESDNHVIKNCHKCGSNHHLMKNCPLVNKFAVKNNFIKYCPLIHNKSCYKCGNKNHLIKYCPLTLL